MSTRARSHAACFAAAAAALVIAVAGCGDAEQPASSTATAPAVAPTPAVLAFGQPHAFPSGVDVLLEAPRVYDVKQSYGPTVPAQVLQVPVTVTNRSTAPIPVSSVSLQTTFNGQPDQTGIALDEPTEVTVPAGTLLPGQTQSFDELYPIPSAPADMVIAVDAPGQPGGQAAAAGTAVYYRGQTPTATGSTAARSTTTRPKPTSTASRPRTTAPSASSKGCGQRAVARGVFDPNCSEYQGYLDPGRSGGRQPSSGDLQRDYGCQQGYIPASEC